MSTPLSALGKPELIRHLVRDFHIHNQSTIKGIGDDAAILQYKNASAVAVNMLMEGVNFDLTYFPLQHLGYKAAVTGFSNLYAMNAIPQQIFVSVAVSAKFSVEALTQLYQGVKQACDTYQVDLAGGDTVSSMTGLAISITAVGEADIQKTVNRNTARQGDLICVSGNLGAAYIGVQVMEREKQMFREGTQPKLDEYAFVIGRLLRPEARRDIIDFFSKENIVPTSMIDISNGLASALLHICRDSGTGCKIFHHKIPVAQQTIDVAEEFFLDPLVTALNGGEDYELLFTVPVEDYEKVIRNQDISIIGHMVDQADGVRLIVEDGTGIELQAQGWKSSKDDGQ